jgi:hypothetical protein
MRKQRKHSLPEISIDQPIRASILTSPRVSQFPVVLERLETDMVKTTAASLNLAQNIRLPALKTIQPKPAEILTKKVITARKTYTVKKR